MGPSPRTQNEGARGNIASIPKTSGPPAGRSTMPSKASAACVALRTGSSAATRSNARSIKFSYASCRAMVVPKCRSVADGWLLLLGDESCQAMCHRTIENKNCASKQVCVVPQLASRGQNRVRVCVIVCTRVCSAIYAELLRSCTSVTAFCVACQSD